MARQRTGADRRKKKRIELSRGVIARYGTLGVVLRDITDSGARIEHYTRLELARKARFRVDWRDKEVAVEAQVMSCRVHRFAPGEETIYQSGLMFTQYFDDALVELKDMTSTIVARSLAEQVANARGIGPVIEKNMPVFRGGSVVAEGLDPKSDKANKRFLPESALVADRGYIRCTLVGRKWDKKWSRQPDQPEEGFTVSATEPSENVEQLCDTYEKASPEDRKLIRLLALASVEKQQDTPEPI